MTSRAIHKMVQLICLLFLSKMLPHRGETTGNFRKIIVTLCQQYADYLPAGNVLIDKEIQEANCGI